MKNNVLLVLITVALVFSFSMSSALNAEHHEKGKESKFKCPHEGSYFCAKEECKYSSDKAGKCPHCGVELKKHEHKVAYVCPMKQCKVKSDKPGKCPKCGMALKEKTWCSFLAKKSKMHKHMHDQKHKHGHKHDHDH